MVIKYEEIRSCEIELAEYWSKKVIQYAKENNRSFEAAVDAVLSDNEEFIEDYDGVISDMGIEFVGVELVKA